LEIQERSGGGAREIIPGFWQREIFFDLKATVLEEALEQIVPEFGTRRFSLTSKPKFWRRSASNCSIIWHREIFFDITDKVLEPFIPFKYMILDFSLTIAPPHYLRMTTTSSTLEERATTVEKVRSFASEGEVGTRILRRLL
jgi:hypothetical protein